MPTFRGQPFGNKPAGSSPGIVMSQVLETKDLAKFASDEEMAMSRVQNLVDELRAIYQLEAEILQSSADSPEEISKAS